MIYNFEDYSLDADLRELRVGDKLVAIEPQVFDLLTFLIRNSGRVVSKDDLISGVWNGRIVSDSTLNSSINAVRQAVGDSGNAQRLIRTVPRKGFRFVGTAREQEEIRKSGPSSSAADQAGPPLPDKPSIAVLPFENFSGDAEQIYFADGMVDEIITALSHFRWLFVIARGSSFSYRGRAVEVKQIGRELGVRYILEGSVRKSESRVRITAQLIDTLSGAHLWADRFDGALKDVFELQDQVTASVVGAIGPKLEQAEIDRARRKPTASLGAYDYYLHGLANIQRDATKEANDEALRLFGKAIELDPNFAAAYGMAALCYVSRQWKRWMVAPKAEVAEATRLVDRAAELGRNDAIALSAAGMTLGLVVRDLDRAVMLLDRSLALNPNFAVSWVRSAWVRIFLGQFDVAIEHASRAMRLSPLDPLLVGMQTVIAFAHFCADRYDQSAAWAAKAVKEQPDFVAGLRLLIASNAALGRMDEATKLIARLREADGVVPVSELGTHLPFRESKYLAKYAETLRRAGFPE